MTQRRQLGISLVELLVGAAVGLIVSRPPAALSRHIKEQPDACSSRPA